MNNIEARVYYDERYRNGYMTDWDSDKKEKIIQIIQNLHLPEFGTAIDFGCGNGIWTDIIRKALPYWLIYGCDISEIAIQNAKSQFPQCIFFHVNDYYKSDVKYDFLFSHHVLEHVVSIESILSYLNSLMKPKSSMLHICPCGNQGSLEEMVAGITKDGINPEMENRFFYEDEGHLRRLTTDRLTELLKPYDYHLDWELYRYQFWGAIQWIVESGIDFINKFADPDNGKTPTDRRLLRQIRRRLLFIHSCKTMNDYRAVRIINQLGERSVKEWTENNNVKAGSEMYLYFKREL